MLGEVRIATLDDADALARMHVESWRWGYRGVMPAAFLDALRVEDRAARWRTILASASDATPTWITRDDDGVTGLASCGPARGFPPRSI